MYSKQNGHKDPAALPKYGVTVTQQYHSSDFLPTPAASLFLLPSSLPPLHSSSQSTFLSLTTLPSSSLITFFPSLSFYDC